MNFLSYMKGNICIIELEGECTFEWTKQLSAYCMDTVGENQPKAVVINLEKVFRIDSSGIGALAVLAKHQPGKIALCRPTGDVSDALKYVKLNQIIPIYPTEAEALDSFQE